MALSTSAALNDFDSTGLQNVISFTPTGSLDLADDAFSSSIAVTETTLDNSTTKAPFARLVFSAIDGFTLGTWDSVPQVKVYMQVVEADGTNDEPEPDATYPGRYVGRFLVDQSTSAQYIQSENLISMAGVKKCKFFIENKTGASIDDDNTSGWKVQAELMSYAPKA